MPLYADVQLRYSEQLAQEVSTGRQRVADFSRESEARAAAGAAEISSIHQESALAVEAAHAEARAEVERIESDRRRGLAEHHQRLLESQERARARRAEMEARLSAAEEAALAAFASGDAEVARIARERTAAVKAAEARAASAADRAEECMRQAHRAAEDALSQARAAVRDIESGGSLSIKQTEERSRRVCVHYRDEICDLQRRVAQQVESLVGQARATGVSLLENRDRADQHLALQLQRTKGETDRIVASASDALSAARLNQRAANAQADEVARDTTEQCRSLVYAQVSEADVMGDAISHYVDAMPWREKVDRPLYFASLEELARSLKAGTLLQPPPRVERASEHNVSQEQALALSCGEN